MKIQPLPPFKALIAFESTARLASFTRAASELNVTQGAISRQIALLEDMLGAHLLDRTTRSVCLTPTGEQYFQASREALLALAEATHQVKRWHGDQQVTVATSTALASLWLLPRIPEFNQRHNGIDLRIVAYDHVKDYRKLECDLAVYYCKTAPPDIKSTPICGEAVFPICSPDYRSRHPMLATPQDLAQCTWLWLDESERDWISWTEWFRRLGLPPVIPRNKINLNSYAMVIQAALSGQGVALGWSNLVDPYLKAGTLVRPIPDALQTEGQFFVLEPTGPHERRRSVASFRQWLLSLE
ncbi:LysR substrate-binding domain-containing protein [Denitromonas ohlonensis]|uniref:LysR family transcriptional regulator n=2 Tax=Denitromonas TaxID=139331 RepID=A0A557S5Y9_9RHOO|nr:LysR substrate-binding domain-containing protein [Denitromonas ohlonensis]TVO68822.1 LysR family transcriptional regulator [Denitromonas ohlonensis]TVO72812.1 LysR family transcriptional regulator [Denitromonas ohlonensis]